MFAWPVLEPTFTSRDAPFAFEVFAWVLTVKDGLNGRFAQPATANGLDTPTLAPWALVTVPVIACWAQFVGLNMNPGRSIVTLTVWMRRGTPSTICGSGSLVTDSALVFGFTRI